MENTYRDVNIALANEFSRLADRFGVDIWEAITISNKHPRVKVLQPGPGVGGHCISVDPWFLVEAAPDLSNLIRTARHVNDSQPHYLRDQLTHIYGDLRGKRIAALGLAYKSDVDDLRESPAIDTVKLLMKDGAKVCCFDPYKPSPDLPELETTSSLATALEGCEIILILVAHRQFQTLDPNEVGGMTACRIVFDAVNAWKSERWRTSVFDIRRLGNSKNIPS
jgi:UDP-N-acetyl-D-mannosaminuronic acid dehydrogenase